MVKTTLKPLNLEEFLQLPETKPASEYIDNQIIQKPLPKGKHSAIQCELIIFIDSILKPKKVARVFPELRCTFGGRSTVPDVSVFVGNRIPTDDNGEIANVFPIAPDWTIEILSPEQSQTKVTKNILHCLNHQSQMGWLIDPDEQCVFVYVPQQQTAVFDEPEMLLPVPSFASELRLSVGELFGWLLK